MQNVSQAGRNVLAKLASARGPVALDALGSRGKRGALLRALQRGRLVHVRPVEVKALELTPAGEAMLGKSATGRTRSSTGEHRKGSAAAKAARICERFHGKMARGALIQKLVRDCRITEASASTYIYNYGKAM